MDIQIRIAGHRFCVPDAFDCSIIADDVHSIQRIDQPFMLPIFVDSFYVTILSLMCAGF